MKRFLLPAVAAAALVPLGMVPAPGLGAQAQRNWTNVVAETPEGGFRLGNPAAPIKLVEYGSFTCNHCARFAGEGVPQLIGKYVKSGRVSFEYRTFVRDPADFSAALLARCAGPAAFFPLSHDYFASQSQWIGRYQAMTDEQKKAIDALPMERKLGRFAAVGGLNAIAAKAGVPAAKAAICLADADAMRKLIEMRRVASETHKVEGTPSFLINGKLVEAHDWGALEPLLAGPGG
ncbi:MAG TPA: thioredoxin domain-containing protein [Allosphingosinicella sp.]|jgi:hypothetical protein